MLHLKSLTDARWFDQVDAHLDEILIDHAHCEKKAAGTALNLIFHYVENRELCQEMTEIVNEELEHFHWFSTCWKSEASSFVVCVPANTATAYTHWCVSRNPTALSIVC